MDVFAMVLGTILIYYLMTKLYKRYPSPFFSPMLTTTIILIVLLSSLSVPYDQYMGGAKWIDAMLGPAIVSLAYPLYMQRGIIKKYKLPIMTSIVVAMFSGLISIILFAKLLRLDDELILSLLSKSITTPVAMQISQSIDGNPALTAVFVIVAGLTGSLLGPFIFKICHIEKAISRGVSIGSASHGIGLAKLSEYGEQVLSMGSVSMTLSAVLGAFICPLFALII